MQSKPQYNFYDDFCFKLFLRSRLCSFMNFIFLYNSDGEMDANVKFEIFSFHRSIMNCKITIVSLENVEFYFILKVIFV